MNFSLHFSEGSRCELVESSFDHSSFEQPARCVRGKLAGAYIGYGTFQWTRAVQALSVLMVRSKLIMLDESLKGIIHPQLVGCDGSLASSLDYALSKRPNWLIDMFSSDSKGEPMAYRVFLRTNPNRKRPGPVSIGLNVRFLGPEIIKLYVSGKELTTAPEFMALRARLENPQWNDSSGRDCTN